MYKITFKMKTAICFIDLPIFDAIIAYAYAREKMGSRFVQALRYREDEKINFDEMPIKKHPDGYFIASSMFYTKEVEYTGAWKKRWANEHDHLADFGKKVRKVKINAGEFKSYDMPINLHHIPQVWFYFDTDNLPEVKRLIDKWISGIGKKISHGYGEFSSFTIDKSDFDFDKEPCRPIPITEEKFQSLISSGVPVSASYTGFRPPYWLPENQGFCITK